MSENVSQAIAGRASTLFEKLASNEALSNLVMGFLGHIIITCAKRGKAVASVRCSTVTESLGDFRFKIEYLPVLLPSPGLWSNQGDDVKRYIAGKSAQMARCFDVNPTLLKTFTSLVEKIDNYCTHKRVPFSQFKIKKSYVTNTDVAVIRSGELSLDNFKGAGRY